MKATCSMLDCSQERLEPYATTLSLGEHLSWTHAFFEQTCARLGLDGVAAAACAMPNAYYKCDPS